MKNHKKAIVQRAYYIEVSYGSKGDAVDGPRRRGTEVLRVEFAINGDTYHQDIPNGDWEFSNPALAVMAYLGIKPSDFDDGDKCTEFGRCEIPVVITGAPDYGMAQVVEERGAKALAKRDWAPDPPRESEEAQEDDTQLDVTGGCGSCGDDGGCESC